MEGSRQAKTQLDSSRRFNRTPTCDRQTDRQTDTGPADVARAHNSVLSLVPRLSTWRYPQPQLGRLQLSVDSRYAAPAAVDRYLLPAPELSSKPDALAAAVDRRDRQTDGQPTVTQYSITELSMGPFCVTQPNTYSYWLTLSLYYSFWSVSGTCQIGP